MSNKQVLNNQHPDGVWTFSADVFTVTAQFKFTNEEANRLHDLYVKLCNLREIPHDVAGKNDFRVFIDQTLKLYIFEHIESNIELLINIEEGTI